MLKLITSFVLFVFVLFSCTNTSEPVENLVALGGKKYGGEFKFMSSEKIQSLFPVNGMDIYSSRILNQIFEPLMRINPGTLETEPCLAESFDVNEDLTEYTFHIRKDVKFQKNDCFKNDEDRVLTPEDVKFTFEYATSGLAQSQASSLLKDYVKGGVEFNESTKDGLEGKSIEGIKVSGEDLIITLTRPYPEFEKVLSNVFLGIVSKKAFERYGESIDDNPVGTGPFILKTKTDEGVDLVRNDEYWRKDKFGNQLPFLSSVHMSYSENKRSQLDAFQKKEVDIVLEIPVEDVPFILGDLDSAHLNVRHRVESQKSLSMSYIGMALGSDEFSDINVRKAIDLAIDKRYIIDHDLQGEGYYAEHGMVPEMGIYQSSDVQREGFNPERARKLLANAGYPNGKNFPKLEIYVNGLAGGMNQLVGESICSQLKKNLNLDFSVKMCSYLERDQAIQSGEAKIWREGWIADIPDPQNFFTLIYGENKYGYLDENFNSQYLAASSEMNPEKRNKLFVECDQIIADQVPLIPVMRGDHIVLVNLRVRDFMANPLRKLYLGDVFIKELKPKKDQE